MPADRTNHASRTTVSHEAAVERYFRVLQTAQAGTNGERRGRGRAAPANINDEIARERKIKNDNAEQDIVLKRLTLNRLFWFLAAETTVVFSFALLQGLEILRLEEWSFKLLLTATIAQITAMLFVAVRYLFPVKSDR